MSEVYDSKRDQISNNFESFLALNEAAEKVHINLKEIVLSIGKEYKNWNDCSERQRAIYPDIIKYYSKNFNQSVKHGYRHRMKAENRPFIAWKTLGLLSRSIEKLCRTEGLRLARNG